MVVGHFGRELGDILADTLSQLRGAYAGDSCLVFGNGPSLTLEIIEEIQESIKGMFSFACNGFCMVFEETKYRPNAVCMSNHYGLKSYLHLYSPETLKFIKAGWEEVIDYVPERIYSLPFSCSHEGGKGLHAKHNELFIGEGNFSRDPQTRNYCGDTVVLDFCVPVAYYMGFKQIFLLGVDCDYTKGYFHPDVIQHSPVGMLSMSSGDDSIAIASYRYTYEYLRSHGRYIYLITPSPKLSFIPTISLQDVIRSRVA